MLATSGAQLHVLAKCAAAAAKVSLFEIADTTIFPCYGPSGGIMAQYIGYVYDERMQKVAPFGLEQSFVDDTNWPKMLVRLTDLFERCKIDIQGGKGHNIGPGGDLGRATEEFTLR